MSVEILNPDGTPMKNNPDVITLDCGCWRGPKGAGSCRTHADSRYGGDPWAERREQRLGELEFLLEAEKTAHRSDNEYLVSKVHAYESVLEKAATGKRPDGTYNFSREALEQFAKQALEEWQLKF